MATNFPTSLDSLTNPTPSSTLNSPSHSAQHADANDAIEALEAKVGVDGSAVTTSLDYRVSNPELVGGAARPLLTGGAYIDGTNGLVLSGLSGNFASTPDSAALSITGDIDIKVKATFADWSATPDTKALAGKYVSVSGNLNQNAYLLLLRSSGILQFNYSPDGTVVSTVAGSSTTAVPFANGATGWVRVTVDVDNGSSQNVIKFYTSTDGSAWTQLGTTLTNAGVISFFDSTSELAIGTFNRGAAGAVDGTIHRVIIQSAFDTADNTTSVVFDADFAAEAADTLAFTEDSGNAATVSVTTTRYTVGYPSTEFNSIMTTNLVANQDYYVTFQVDRTVEFDMFVLEVTAAAASSSTIYFGVYPADNDYQPNGNVLATGNAVVGTSTGVFYTQITPVTLPPGKYVVITNASVTTGIRSWVATRAQVRHTLGFSSLISGMTRGRAASTFPTTTVNWNALSVNATGLPHPVLLRWKAA